MKLSCARSHTAASLLCFAVATTATIPFLTSGGAKDKKRRKRIAAPAIIATKRRFLSNNETTTDDSTIIPSSCFPEEISNDPALLCQQSSSQSLSPQRSPNEAQAVCAALMSYMYDEDSLLSLLQDDPLCPVAREVVPKFVCMVQRKSSHGLLFLSFV
jgi:hypothetical protein